MGSRREVIYEGDIVKELSELPILKKLGISEDLIQLIIDDYIYRKSEFLIKGDIVTESNIGYTRLNCRYIAPNLQDKTSYTIKCTTRLNGKTKSIAYDRISQDTEESRELLYKLSNGFLELEDLK